MTEHRARRTRWPKGRLRALAWGTGGAAFIMAAAPLVAAPKPPVDQAKQAHRPPAKQVIERHITRRVIIVDPVAPTTTSGSSGWSGSSSTGSSAGSTYQPAPAPAPPTTTTGGS